MGKFFKLNTDIDKAIDSGLLNKNDLRKTDPISTENKLYSEDADVADVADVALIETRISLQSSIMRLQHSSCNCQVCSPSFAEATPDMNNDVALFNS